MNRATSFSPIADGNARVLILGSMPGRASLRAGQYYAHPRNAFWPIMQTTFGIDERAPYRQRCQQLRRHRVALWDVLHACTRPGSLDAMIDASSMVANDFRVFYSCNAQIVQVFFNGAMAEKIYLRQVLPGLQGSAAALKLTRLPSTSPAHAALSLSDKRLQWRAALAAALEH